MMNRKSPKHVPSSTVQQQVGTVLRRVGVNGEHLVIDHRGFPIAALVPINDYRAMINLLAEQKNS